MGDSPQVKTACISAAHSTSAAPAALSEPTSGCRNSCVVQTATHQLAILTSFPPAEPPLIVLVAVAIELPFQMQYSCCYPEARIRVTGPAGRYRRGPLLSNSSASSTAASATVIAANTMMAAPKI